MKVCYMIAYDHDTFVTFVHNIKPILKGVLKYF